MAPRQLWLETLPLQLRLQDGEDWSVGEVGATSRNPIGRRQLIRIHEDRTRWHVRLPPEWKPTNSTAIATTVGQLRNLSTQDALKLNTELLSGGQRSGDELAGWPEVAPRDIEHRLRRDGTPLIVDPAGVSNDRFAHATTSAPIRFCSSRISWRVMPAVGSRSRSPALLCCCR